MMFFKSKEYPFGKYQVLWLEGEIFSFKRFGFWKHPTGMLGCFCKWTMRLGIIELKCWLSENER
jgi:hypothetical protein